MLKGVRAKEVMLWQVEPWVLSEDALHLFLKFYKAALVEFEPRYRTFRRITNEGWRPAKGNGVKAVIPRDLNELRAAARHPRVDIVVVSGRTWRYADESEVNLVKQFSKAIEVIYWEVIEWGRKVRYFKRLVELCYKKEVPLAISSKARSVYEFVHPYQKLALLQLMGFSEEDAKAILGISSAWLYSLGEARGR